MQTGPISKTSSTEPTLNSDFEFLFTRSIEFRQETIYFIIVDRFYDVSRPGFSIRTSMVRRFRA